MSRTSLGLITSGALNGGAKKALHWITSGLIRIGVVRAPDGGLVIVGRPVDHEDLVGNAAYVSLRGAPVHLPPIAGIGMMTEYIGSTPNLALVGKVSEDPVLTLTGRPAADYTIAAEHDQIDLIGAPTDIGVLTGDQNDVELD